MKTKTKEQLINELVEVRKRITESEILGTGLEAPEAKRKQMEKRPREPERFLSKIFDSIQDPFCILDRDYKIVRTNEAYVQMRSKPVKELLGEKCYKILYNRNSVCEDCVVQKAFMSGDPCAKEKHLTLPDGTEKWHEIYTYPIIDEKGTVSHVIEYVRDVTDRKQAEEMLKESEKKYRNIVDNTLVGVYKTNLKGDILYVNEALAKMFEFKSPEEMMSESVLVRYKNPKDREVLIENLKKTGRVNNFEIEIVTKIGRAKNILLSATLGGDVLSGMIMDITERKRMERELEKLASTDRLTQAYNRLKFEEIIRREIERVKRYNQLLSMAMLDIDHFKKVNDTYGHLAGDYVLKTIADIVRENIRKLDYLVRWGGEEFMIISPETDLERAEELAERIRKVIGNYSFDKAGKVTVSFGVSQFKEGDTEDDFIKRVDDALYKAKTNGRNRVEISV